jgi:hypothetical protein
MWNVDLPGTESPRRPWYERTVAIPAPSLTEEALKYYDMTHESRNSDARRDQNF